MSIFIFNLFFRGWSSNFTTARDPKSQMEPRKQMELVQVQMESMEPTELMESTEMFEGKLKHDTFDVINQRIQL